MIATIIADYAALKAFLAVAGPIEAKVAGFVFGVAGVVLRALVAGIVAASKSVVASLFPAQVKGE